jgi:hypothetical protein
LKGEVTTTKIQEREQKMLKQAEKRKVDNERSVEETHLPLLCLSLAFAVPPSLRHLGEQMVRVRKV